MPGAGTTTVAGILGERLDAPVLDTDVLVARAAGVEAEDAFVDLGEERFRTLERAAVAEALASPGVVVALGSGALGSTLEDAAGRHARAALADARERGTRVVALTASLAAATPRIGLVGAQPVGFGAPRALLVRFAKEREPLYRALAEHTLDTSRASADQVADSVAAWAGWTAGAGGALS